MNWSSGKDSALTLYRLIKAGKKPELLLTTISKEEQRVGMHGLRRALLEQQAEAIGIPLKIIELSASNDHEAYNKLMTETMDELKAEGFDTAVFGDIFLEDLKAYRESQLAGVGIKGEFPLWKEDTKALIEEFVNSGFSSMIVSAADEHFDKEFLGAEIDEYFMKRLPEGVDPCGENGEFHSFCFKGPIFEKKIAFKKGQTVIKYYDKPMSTERDENTKTPNSQLPSPNSKIAFHYLDLLPIN
jgi:uncharacterized protein (TIGR00290 family)